VALEPVDTVVVSVDADIVAVAAAAAVVVVDDDEVVVWDDETNGIEHNGEGMIRDGERLQSEPIADHLVHGGRKKEAFRYA